MMSRTCFSQILWFQNREIISRLSMAPRVWSATWGVLIGHRTWRLRRRQLNIAVLRDRGFADDKSANFGEEAADARRMRLLRDQAIESNILTEVSVGPARSGTD